MGSDCWPFKSHALHLSELCIGLLSWHCPLGAHAPFQHRSKPALHKYVVGHMLEAGTHLPSGQRNLPMTLLLQ